MTNYQTFSMKLRIVFRLAVGGTFTLLVIFMFVPTGHTVQIVLFSGYMISLVGMVVTEFIVDGPAVLRRLSEVGKGSIDGASEVQATEIQLADGSKAGNILATLLAITIVVVVAMVWWFEHA